MKQFHIAEAALKYLLLIGILTACQNDQTIFPTKIDDIATTDQNARGNSQLRLVKRGYATIQYAKNGNFFGKISKLLDGIYRTEYTYDDNNPSGLLKITSKRYNTSTNKLIEEITYKVSNGLCIESSNLTSATHDEYYYNAQGLLDEIKHYSVTGDFSRKFTYFYSPATSSYRLDKIETSNNAVQLKKVSITYSSKPDNYSLNPEHTGLDRYLPIFGKFSDVLTEQYVELPLGSLPLYHKFLYAIDSDGYVTLEQIEHSYGGSNKWYDSVILQYSSNWQGI